MANVVQTDFIANLSDAPQKIQQYAGDLNKLADAGGNSLSRINAFNNTVADLKTPTFAADLTKDFNKLGERTDKLQKDFNSIASQRLDAGNVGNLTKEIVRASERSRQLQSDVRSIQKEINNPNRKSSIGFLTDELKAAQTEAESLNRKLDRVNAKDAASSTTGRAGRGGRSGGRRGGYSEGLLTGLELVDDFAPAGLNRPFNAAVKGLVGVNALTGTALIGLGAVAAAGVGLVKISQNIREEAERRLKVEEMIAGAINKQILSQREALSNQAKFLADAAEDRSFTRNLPTKSLDELKNRRDLLLQINRLLNARVSEIDPTTKKLVFKDNPDFQRNTQQINALNAQIEQIPFDKQKTADAAFNQRNETFKKNQEDARAAEIRRVADLKKREEEAKAKINDFRDTLVSSASKENPLVKQMTDLETVTERAKAKFGVFGDSVVSKIADIERADLNKAIGLQKFENNFEALKLTQQARQLASAPERAFAPFQRNLELVERKVDSFSKVFDLSKKIEESDFYANRYNPNNPQSFEDSRMSFAEKARGGGGLKLRDAIEEIKSLQNLSLEGTGIYGKNAVADKVLAAIPSRDELLKALESPFSDVRGNADFLLQTQSSSLFDKREFEKQKFNDFLQDQKNQEFGKKFANEQIDLINRDRGLNDADKSRRRLSVTDALGNDLDPKLKQQRILDSYQVAQEKNSQAAEAMQIAQDTKEAVQAILKGLADKGFNIVPPPVVVPASPVNVTVQLEDGSPVPGGMDRPTAADVDNYYSPDDESYRIGDSRTAGSLYGAKITRR